MPKNDNNLSAEDQVLALSEDPGPLFIDRPDKTNCPMKKFSDLDFAATAKPTTFCQDHSCVINVDIIGPCRRKSVINVDIIGPFA